MAQGPQGEQGIQGKEGPAGPRGNVGYKSIIGLLFVGFVAAVTMMITGIAAGDDAQTLTSDQHELLQQSPLQWTGVPTSPMPVSQHPDYAKFTFDFAPNAFNGYKAPISMLAHHGPACQGPPNNITEPNNSPTQTHPVSTFPNSIFTCNNHLMTALSAGTAYAEIGIIPNRLLDFTNGGVLQWEQSTFLSTHPNREWLDVLITPFDQTVGYNDDRPSPAIGPRTGIQLRQLGGWHINRMDNFTRTGLSNCCHPTMSDGIVTGTNESATRQTFKLTLSRTNAKFERLQSNTAGQLTFFDVAFNPPLSFTQGVVRIGQHSYDPPKGCTEGVDLCVPGTWHWDEINPTPAIEFTAIKANQEYVDIASPVATFPQPAPANAYIRYTSGFAHQISFNNGSTWVTPRVTSNSLGNEFPHSIMQAIPAGTTQVRFQFPPGGCPSFSSCWANSISIWAQTGAQAPTPVPTATVTRTPLATATPIRTATPVPGVPTNTPVATATAVPFPTGTVAPGKCYADVHINPGPTGTVTGRNEKPC